jgi:hypothetical protein
MVALLLLLGALGAPAEPSLAAEVEQLGRAVSSSDWSAAATRARALEARLSALAPLELGDAQVLVEPAAGLGIYTPLPGGVARQAELYLYAQVRNHGLRQLAGGWELHLVSDLVVLDEEGNELARDEGFGESRFVARAPPRDTFVSIALRVTGLPSGSYRVRLVMHDRVGKKSQSVEIPFRMP